MAGTTTDYTIGVKSIYDATGLKTGVTTATQALTTLESEVQSSAQAMDADFANVDTSIGTTFGPTGTLSTSADTVLNTSGRKLKAAGKTIGADFAQSLTGGIASGDIVGSVSGIATSLAAFGGFAAVGLGIGAALITGIVKGANANATEMRTRVNDLLKGVEDDFKGSMKSIRDDLLEGVSSINVLEELGGGGEDALVQGLAKAREFAQGTGLELEQVVEVLQGKMKPATHAVLQEQLDQLSALEDVELATGKVYAEEVRRKSPAGQLIDLYEIQRSTLGKAKDDARDLYDIQRDTSDVVGNTAEYSERYAAALERADAAARLLAGRRLPSSDVMNGTG